MAKRVVRNTGLSRIPGLPPGEIKDTLRWPRTGATTVVLLVLLTTPLSKPFLKNRDNNCGIATAAYYPTVSNHSWRINDLNTIVELHCPYIFILTVCENYHNLKHITKLVFRHFTSTVPMKNRWYLVSKQADRCLDLRILFMVVSQWSRMSE